MRVHTLTVNCLFSKMSHSPCYSSHDIHTSAITAAARLYPVWGNRQTHLTKRHRCLVILGEAKALIKAPSGMLGFAWIFPHGLNTKRQRCQFRLTKNLRRCLVISGPNRQALLKVPSDTFLLGWGLVKTVPCHLVPPVPSRTAPFTSRARASLSGVTTIPVSIVNSHSLSVHSSLVVV